MSDFPQRPVLFACLLLLLSLVSMAARAESADSRPNILLIVAEDMSGRVGAFGDSVARTPHIDALAARGVRYPNAFTVSGVCAPSRSGLITGVYPISMGTHQMRTGGGVPGTEIESYEAVPPAAVKAFPELLRRAGYATANFAKKDYQFGEPFTIWDVDMGSFMSPLEPAPWRQLPGDKPFFAMINLMATHESRLASPDARGSGRWEELLATLQAWQAEHVTPVTDPADVAVPAYYPDNAMVRASIARHYDNIHYMDAQVGAILEALEADGLSDNTLVIWTTDHGDGLPRAKRAVYDSGIRVPMVLRFPDGRHAGTERSRLVSFVDIAPTLLALAGAPVPGFIQGRNFLDGEPRGYVFAARDRMDKVPDRVRAVRDERYAYLRNYRPELAYFRPLLFRDMFPVMRALWDGSEAGTLAPEQRFYFTAPRPEEELYDIRSDPEQLHNLAGDPAHAAVRERLSARLDQWLETVGDRGAEAEIEMLASMWPGLEQPRTRAPRFELDERGGGNRMVQLHSETEGASIGYRIDGGDWQLYSRPVPLASGQTLEAKAVRYGYAESPVTSVAVGG